MDSEELKHIFSTNLLYWLEYRGKTQADLYKVTGVSSATASDWCNGKKLPRTDKIVDIATWLMVELTDLMTETRHDYGDEDRVIYRIKDDEEFKTTVLNILSLSKENYKKVKEYIDLLKK